MEHSICLFEYYLREDKVNNGPIDVYLQFNSFTGMNLIESQKPKKR